MIRLGIVGCNFGRSVLLPAFRADPRCAVVALAGSDETRAAALARESGVPRSFGHWNDLVADQTIDAVAIAVPPELQPEIAIRALQSGKAVFAEKPLAADMDAAHAVLRQAQASGRPFMIDFEFAELPTWRRAKGLIDQGALGTLRHVTVTWNVENYATRMRLKNWKTSSEQGGGVLGNFVSHCFYYLENFCGPMRDVSAQLFGLPGGGASRSSAAISGRFVSGAAYMISMSAASFLGSGHRIEFYGEDGTLALSNTTTDYMRGFQLFHARRPAEALAQIDVADRDQDRYSDGRIAPVARLAARFLDSIEKDTNSKPGIAEAIRVQTLISMARRSSKIGGQSVAVEQ